MTIMMMMMSLIMTMLRTWADLAMLYCRTFRPGDHAHPVSLSLPPIHFDEDGDRDDHHDEDGGRDDHHDDYDDHDNDLNEDRDHAHPGTQLLPHTLMINDHH